MADESDIRRGGDRAGAGAPVTVSNLFSGYRTDAKAERFDALLERPGLVLERIVSCGQASPLDHWYDQEQAEWVILLRGSAGILFEGDSRPIGLQPGDHLFIPPHRRHRVDWTDPKEPTVWLALHLTRCAGVTSKAKLATALAWRAALRRTELITTTSTARFRAPRVSRRCWKTTFTVMPPTSKGRCWIR